MEINQENSVQLDELIQHTKLLAETLITLRQDEKEHDHKVNIIGTAMIHQRDTLQSLVDGYQVVHDDISSHNSRAGKHGDMIDQLIEKSDGRFQQLQKTHEAQQEFMASFDRLHEKHQQLIDANDENYKEYEKTLVLVVDAVSQLQTRIVNMNAINQTKAFTEETENLYEHIQSYIDTRQAFQTNQQNMIEDLSDEIDIFNKTLKGHMEDINDMHSVVESCDQQSKEINEKFDQFTEQYGIKVRQNTDTLDKAFKQPKSKDGATRGFFNKLFGGGKNE